MSNETYTLTYEDCSEVYATYALARAAQVELNAMGMIGSSIDETEN